jgi:hypothetical protein
MSAVVTSSMAGVDSGRPAITDPSGVTIDSLNSGAGYNALDIAQTATNYILSALNSTTAQLGSSATFTGTIETIYNQQDISMLLTCDQNGTLTINQYIDLAGTRKISSWVYSISAGVPFSRSFVGNGNYFNITFQNTGVSTTTTLNINTAYGTIGKASNLGNLPISLDEVSGKAFSLTTGSQVNTKPFGLPENDWQFAGATGGIVNTSDVAVKAAGAAGIRNFVTGISVQNASATVATEVVVKDGASTVLWRGYVGTSAVLNSAVSVTFPTPLRGTAATAVNVACITTGAQVYVNAQGYTAP